MEPAPLEWGGHRWGHGEKKETAEEGVPRLPLKTLSTVRHNKSLSSDIRWTLSALVTVGLFLWGMSCTSFSSSFGTEVREHILIRSVSSWSHWLRARLILSSVQTYGRSCLLNRGIWSEAKYSPSLGSSRDTIQGGQLLQKVLVKSWVRNIRYF